jgi:phosphoribosylformylglycinamidine synthase
VFIVFFTSGVAPFPGAETGTGGRLRDIQATGRGAYTLAGISSYCVGNLLIPSHPLPWEDATAPYPSNLATPLQIQIDASNGASDYGNKYGEPVVAGFTRSFGQRLPSGERYEWIKPIMFTAGVGMMDDRHKEKGSPEEGMIVCKVGGPAYRIGMGGGAASSRVQGTAEAELDFSAVQRGDAEMENRMNRVIRGCIELGGANPIVSIHDQGAGGNGNVLKEIVDPLGARFEIRDIPSGDPTLSVLELWGAEYQENNAILVRPEGLAIVQALGTREHCAVTPVGVVTSSGRVVVHDNETNTTPFDLPLSLVLGKMPQKTFSFQTIPPTLIPLSLPADITIMNALDRVLRLLDVGSKRFLTNKVDRSVTGLIAQQQCVGPLQLPLSNVAVLAQSHFTTTGVAVAVGEQPIKGLISPSAQARLTVAEGLSNLVFAKITALSDVKASGNWMWAAKLPGEGVKMYEACKALRDLLIELGPSIDGGKDSLSMAAKVQGETVKSPGEITFTCYAACPDITKTITPDLRYASRKSVLYYIDLGEGKTRLGGTALATVFNQVGNETPDVENIVHFKACFDCIQTCVDQRLCGGGHDRSDGGLIVTLLEMAFAGNCGIHIHTMPVVANRNPIEVFFAEELGFVFEVLPVFAKSVESIFKAQNLSIHKVGYTTLDPVIHIEYNQQVILHESTALLRSIWESTSFALERLQTNPDCVQQEETSLATRKTPSYQVKYPLKPTPSALLEKPLPSKPCIAVIRQEGSNGDREMLSAFYSVGFDAWDVNMHDLLNNTITVDRFQGIIFCGGFSYADVNDSAKGWASVIKFNPHLLAQFEAFRKQEHTFSLGICNGCQLMALLGWVPFADNEVVLGDGNKESLIASEQPRFIHNTSGRFESRWSTVKILPSPAVLLKGMEGSTLGVWVAHGEGRAYFPNAKHLEIVEANQLAPLRYVNDENQETEAYPFNPNGSPHGIAGLCSQDGRHLALMPHPERCFLKWQLPYMTNEMRESYQVAPWLRFFQNAYEFAVNQQQEA